jgi:hypothetical protein
VDDNTRDVLVTALQVGLGAGATIIGGVLAYVFGRRTEKARWDHEDQMRAKTFEREDKVRWLADRRLLYAAFTAAVNKLLDQSRDIRAHRVVSPEQWVPVWDDLYRVYTEISLVAPGVRPEANALYRKVVQVFQAAQRGEPIPIDPELQSHQELHGPLEAFLRAARKDLTGEV